MTHKQAFLSPDKLSATARLRDAAYLRDLWRELVVRDLKLRYKGSFLGLAWSLLNPLAQLLVFTFVFQYILPLEIENYSAFLFAGLLVWSWFQSSLSASATVIVDGRSLIKRPGFPAAILPVVTVSANMIHFLLALPILFVFLLAVGIRPQNVLALLPFIIALQFLFTLSLSYFLAAIHVTFRDTQHLVNVFLLLFFYLSPIFYDTTIIPDRFQSIYHLNPMVPLLEAYRDIFLNGRMPDLAAMALLGGLSLLLLGIGYHVFMRTSYTFVEEL